MALDHGVDFLDNWWDYHDGKSEERMGQALRSGYRNKAFLMTKLDGRTKQKANEQLEQSLFDTVQMPLNVLDVQKVSAIECLHYAMNLPVSVVITGCEVRDVQDHPRARRHVQAPGMVGNRSVVTRDRRAALQVLKSMLQPL